MIFETSCKKKQDGGVDNKGIEDLVSFIEEKVMVINKIDLLPVLDSDISKIKENALSINKDLIIFETSCKKKQDGGVDNKGIEDLVSFIEEKVKLKADEFQRTGNNMYF